MIKTKLYMVQTATYKQNTEFLWNFDQNIFFLEFLFWFLRMKYGRNRAPNLKIKFFSNKSKKLIFENKNHKKNIEPKKAHVTFFLGRGAFLIFYTNNKIEQPISN